MNESVVALVVFLLNPPLVAQNGIEPRATFELRTYASKTECGIQAVGLKIHFKGARVRCIVRDLSPDEKSALRLAEGRR